MDIAKKIATITLTIILSPIISVIFMTALIAAAIEYEDNSHNTSDR